MRFLFSKRSVQNSKKIGIKHWIKVWILIGVVGLLSWYGKVYEPKPTLTRINEFAVWIMPHKNGLGALVVLPNDGNDSNNVKTGLRIWLSPPDSLLLFEQNSALRYRGRNIIVVGDSLNDKLKEDMLSTLDTNGNFYWLGPFNEKLMGEDASAELIFFDGKPQDYIFDLVHEGHKLRFFGSQIALDSAKAEPLSAAILMFNRSEPPLMDSEVQVLVWKGKSELNSNRIALDYPEAMALISNNKKHGFGARRMHIKDWDPNY
ncbi:MAG: hypothetical protein LBU89_01265 [Fibromonadaceae bacterium]|jgi:hypothetical protein|nr:hypothetical protein [Fibromonadaceae bacterium]